MPLPEGYVELEYIESTGTQYIDTEFKPNGNTRVLMDAQMTKAKASTFFFGARTKSTTINYNLLYTAGGIRSDYGESKVTSSAVTVTNRLNIDKNKSVCTVGKTVINNAASAFQSSFNLYLFADNFGGGADYFGSLKLFSCSIYDGSTLIRNFVPCRTPVGEVGLYDLVNSLFYANSGTGEFTGGPVLPPRAPENFRFSVLEDQKVRLEWDPVSGASGYRLEKEGALLADQENTAYEDQVREYFIPVNYRVYAYNSSGDSDAALLMVILIPANPIMHLITDRSQQDVDRVKNLTSLWREDGWSGTDEELEEYRGELKGRYTASDLNRVGTAMAYLRDRFNDNGYDLDISPKTDWREVDAPTESGMTLYLSCLGTLRGALSMPYGTPETPATMKGLTYTTANNIEKILETVDQMLTLAINAVWYSGEIYSGEVM